MDLAMERNEGIPENYNSPFFEDVMPNINEEMDTINKDSESPDLSITSCWVLLSTNEDAIPEVPENAQEKIKMNLATERNEDIPENHNVPFFEDVIPNINDTNNKSDAESDGISIISESEFYQSKSDDDCSTNSSDENTVDHIKNGERQEFQCEHVNKPLKSHEIPVDLDGISSISSLANEDNDMAQDHMTDSNIFEKSSARILTQSDFDKNDSDPKKYDKNFMTKEFIDSFKVIFKHNRMCFISTLILAITVSYISSKLTQEGSVDQKQIQEDVQKKYLEIARRELQNEREKLNNWHATVAREKKKFKEWENKLLAIEQKLNGKMKNKATLYVDIGSKIKSKNGKKKKITKKIDGFRPDRSFEDKKGFKTYKTGNKKMNALHSENRRSKHAPRSSEELLQSKKNCYELSESVAFGLDFMKGKIYNFVQNDGHERIIPVSNDAKNVEDLYTQKVNQSSTLDDNKTIRGEWYLNLLRGRMEKRAKDEKARWWFDRASYRNIKRNKAYWYFQYMFNREDLRYHLKSKTKNI